MSPTILALRVTFAFANILHDRPILQSLVNDFCARWDPERGFKTDADALTQFPPAFTARVVRRYSHCGREKKFDACYLEYKSEEAKETCKKVHMELDEGTDYGFFGEPRPVPYQLNSKTASQT